jgi:hypothetical protein
VINRLFGKSNSQPSSSYVPSIESLTTDPCLGDPAVHEWHKRLSAGDDEAFRVYLMTEPDSVRRDVTLVAVLDALPDRASWLDRWVDKEPENHVARIARGTNLVDWAWEARGHLRAQEVTGEQWNQFFPRLEAAWRDFEAAIAIIPDDGSAYALMIDAAKGLQVGVERGLAIYEAAQSRRPWHPVAHESIIQLLAPKWSRSTVEMWDLARKVTRAAPEGSPVHGVIADAHVEAWIETPEAAKSRYWQNEAVRAEIVEAAARSVESPLADRSRPMMRARSSFAYCFARLNDRERLRRQLDALGPVVGGPFLYSTVALQQAAEVRRWAYAGQANPD